MAAGAATTAEPAEDETLLGEQPLDYDEPEAAEAASQEAAEAADGGGGGKQLSVAAGERKALSRRGKGDKPAAEGRSSRHKGGEQQPGAEALAAKQEPADAVKAEQEEPPPAAASSKRAAPLLSPSGTKGSADCAAAAVAAKPKRAPIPSFAPREAPAAASARGAAAKAGSGRGVAGGAFLINGNGKRAASPGEGSGRETKRSTAGASERSEGDAAGAAVAAVGGLSALRIDNFVRPFTEKALHELLSASGTLVHFWLAQVKTHCFATFETHEQASAAFRALDGLQWPAASPSRLKPALMTAIGAAQAETIASGKGGLAALPPSAGDDVAMWGSAAASSPLAAAVAAGAASEEAVLDLNLLFRKTDTQPGVYWLPLTVEGVAARRAKIAERKAAAAAAGGSDVGGAAVAAALGSEEAEEGGGAGRGDAFGDGDGGVEWRRGGRDRGGRRDSGRDRGSRPFRNPEDRERAREAGRERVRRLQRLGLR